MDGGARWAWKWRKAPDFILSLGYIEQYIGLKILNINDYLVPGRKPLSRAIRRSRLFECFCCHAIFFVIFFPSGLQNS
jgi:hypothetical protein